MRLTLLLVLVSVFTTGAHAANIVLRIVGVEQNQVNPLLINNILNGSSSSTRLLAVNATKEATTCDIGYTWNGTHCNRCMCSGRAQYANTWVEFVPFRT